MSRTISAFATPALRKRQDRLRDNQANVLLQSFAQPPAGMLNLIARSGMAADEHVFAAQFDVERLHVVSPKVESTTTVRIESRVVPVACNHSIFTAALVEREAHMRAAIVDGPNIAGIVEQHDGPIGAPHYDMILLAELR
jgi:hypothetical protein